MSQSGLRALTRDWSSSSTDTELYSWPPTSQTQSAPAPTPTLTAKEQRMRAIQAGLSQPQGAGPLFSSSSKKRSSDGADNLEPPAKKRLMPWNTLSLDGKDEDPTEEKPATSMGAPVSQRGTAKVFLSQEQKHILKLVTHGSNIFYTGSAGTGKSVLLREIIRALKQKFTTALDAVAITASTGIAACNIGGVTLHSFGGIGIGVETAEQLANKIRKNKKATGRWLRTKVLIIDEVSMVDGELFDKLEKIARLLRKSQRPFGGIQLILTGDFFQLPPVSKTGAKFAFEADTWKECIPKTFNLTKVFRQKDQEFVDMLNEMRFGKLSQRTITKFESLSRPISYNDGVEPTELFSRREDVDRANLGRNKALQGETHMYTATDGGSVTDAQQREKLLSNFMAPTTLQLKINAQVMLIKNTDDMLVNGTIGTVISFDDPATYKANGGETLEKDKENQKKPRSSKGPAKLFPVVRFVLANGKKREVIMNYESFKVELPNGEVQASRSQLPLILAWAMSIHKSQGQTIPRVKVDLGRVFEKGQAYVALSRATSLAGLQVLNFRSDKVMAHPKVAEWTQSLECFTES